jgi:hypothetical protein
MPTFALEVAGAAHIPERDIIACIIIEEITKYV